MKKIISVAPMKTELREAEEDLAALVAVDHLEAAEAECAEVAKYYLLEI